MSIERRAESVNPQVDAQAAQNLSQQVFNNPAEFLSTLRADFNQMRGRSMFPELNELELTNYVNGNHDEKSTAAAKIALSHFDELAALNTDTPHDPRAGSGAINAGDLDQELAFANKKDDDIIASRVREDNIKALALYGASGAMIVGAGAAMVGSLFTAGTTSPLGLALVGGSVATTAWGGTYANDAAAAPNLIRQQATTERQILASWPEINGGQTSPAA